MSSKPEAHSYCVRRRNENSIRIARRRAVQSEYWVQPAKSQQAVVAFAPGTLQGYHQPTVSDDTAHPGAGPRLGAAPWVR
jgi:hypothetical protein